MTKDQKIERINSYLPHLKDEVLDAFLGLLKNTRTELEDDEWDLQMQEDAKAGRFEKLINDPENTSAGGLLEGLQSHQKKVTS